MGTDLHNRESYLESAVESMRPWFAEHDVTVPEVRISIGWPKGARGKHVVGQHFSPENATDAVGQIFISPDRGGDLTVDILATVLHEMIHAAVGNDEGHKGQFIVVARKVQFTGPWTSSQNRTEELDERLAGLAERLGEIPHGALSVGEKTATQKTYMRLVQHEPCGWKIRCTQKQLDLASDIITCWACGEEAQIEDPSAGK